MELSRAYIRIIIYESTLRDTPTVLRTITRRVRMPKKRKTSLSKEE